MTPSIQTACHVPARGLAHEWSNGILKHRCESRGTRDRQNPGPDDVACYPPAHRGHPLYRSNPDNSSGDSVGRAQGYAEEGKKDDGSPAAGLRAKTSYGLEFGEAHGERFYDTPPSGVGAQGNCCMAGQNHPEGND